MEIEAFVAALGGRRAVLEVGSGGGRDADAVEARGLAVRRTDVSSGLVDLMRSRGHLAEVLDPLSDELGGPYDGIWANASLLHVARPDLGVVLRRLAAATRAGGSMGASLKEGDGEGWSAHGRVRAARRFTFWRETQLRDVLTGAGWRVDRVEHRIGLRDQGWLMVRASRDGA